MRSLSVKNFRGLALLIPLSVLLIAADIWLGLVLGWPLAVALLVASAGWGTAMYFRSRAARASSAFAEAQMKELQPLRERLFESERERSEVERRMQVLQRINRSLADAASGALDERGLMDAILSTLTGMTGALGCSFVPVDEWQQPMPAFTFGQLPAPVLSAWSAHLASNMLRERCGSCQVLESTPGACPLHPQEVGGTLAVYCLPLTGGQPEKVEPVDDRVSIPSARGLGVLHFYLPSGRRLEPGMRAFLESLLPEIALAYQATHLRSQETATLRQLQMLHAPENDFAASLNSLLNGVRQALEMDFVVIRLRASAGERLSGLNVQSGDVDSSIALILQTALEAIQGGIEAASPVESVPAWLALPLIPPENYPDNRSAATSERTLGILLAGCNRPCSFHDRQKAMMQTVAAQAALLLENERLIRSLEYKIVIQERARLAREIHDGLAQTLAFLKLQAAQMQSYLSQGNHARLAQVLQENYQALAEAYLDTRQSIDNLRMTPQEGLEHWLEQLLHDFERSSGLSVKRDIHPLSHSAGPEVQAHLIRIVQEALSNIRKHARAQHSLVQLHEWSGELILEISDDGLGFDAEDVPEVSRYGLRGMRERAEMIGADFQIISRAHEGTTVRLALPAWYEEEPSQ